MPIYVDSPSLLISPVRYDIKCRCGHVLCEREERFDYYDVSKQCPSCGRVNVIMGCVNRARFSGMDDGQIRPGEIPVNLHAEIALDGFVSRMDEPWEDYDG